MIEENIEDYNIVSTNTHLCYKPMKICGGEFFNIQGSLFSRSEATL